MEIRQKAAQLKILYASAHFSKSEGRYSVFHTHTQHTEERKTNVDMTLAH